MKFLLETTEESYNLQASVGMIGQDILIAIWGGEKPHIGAVSITQARPSIQDPQAVGVSTSVFCFLGHKEDDLAKMIGERIAQACKTNVVVTAGIHWDHITEEGIQKVIENSAILAKMIIEQIQSQMSSKL
ncbi:MAG: hypothetical protein HQM14_11315 [SAR324 cluster bacterium]|nr:hypothetical protein [SAR324 cluster bacterium]